MAHQPRHRTVGTKFFDSYQGKLLNYFESEKQKYDLGVKPHGLDSRLIVSITSHRPRFEYLHLTVKSILEQIVHFDKLVLWIAYDDFAFLPRSIQAIRSPRFEIRQCTDIRSYKKLVFSLIAFPDDFIVIADDDVYYPYFWLHDLVFVNDSCKNAIRSHMVLRYHHTGDGHVAPYYEWSYDIQDGISRVPSVDLLPLGVGGVLYPPRSLHSAATHIERFQRVCPDADDFWFYAMSRLQGSQHVKVGTRFRKVEWPGSQNVALWIKNSPTQNDAIIRNVIQEFGIDVFSAEQTPCCVSIQP